VDLQERRQLEVSGSVAKVRAKARPWRSIFALLIAIAGVIAAEVSGVNGWHKLGRAPHSNELIFLSGSAAFLVFGLAAAIGLSGLVRSTTQNVIGQAHAGVLRYVLLLVGVLTVITIELAIGHIEVRQLLVSGAVLGVLVGIAAQQSLANLFAGLVLLFARPFRVGDRVRFRAGALSGEVEGMVIDVSLTYVRLQTDEGPVLLPNSQALAAAVLLLPNHGPADPGSGPGPGGASTGVAWPPPSLSAQAGNGPSVIPDGTVRDGTVRYGSVPDSTAPGDSAPGGIAPGGIAGGSILGGTARQGDAS
jgi:hypothetical protein